MSKIILGLDLGITSIGWALVSIEDEKPKNKIIESGVRIFTIAEHPKDGKSLALPRREFRGARRTLQRKSKRMIKIKYLLLRYGLITSDDFDAIFLKDGVSRKDVWELRKDALERCLHGSELFRVMVHIAKHRGYASNSKSDELSKDDKEGKAVLSGISNNESVLENEGYLTIGQYIASKKRKRNATGHYENSISRAMLKDEIRLIFEKQKSFASLHVSDALLEKYISIAFTQRPLKSVDEMVANCPFETDEKRAPKAAISFEKFRALQKLKNIRILKDDSEVKLSQDEINRAVKKALNVGGFTHKTLKKELGIAKDTHIKGLTYHDHKTGEIIDPEGKKFLDFSAYQKIQKAVFECDEVFWNEIKENDDVLDEIVTILSYHKDDAKAVLELERLLNNEKVSQALLHLSFSGFGHLSLKALKKINPELEKGVDYDKACDEVGYDFKAIFQGEKTLLLPPLSKQENLEMTNPVVKRAIAQMRLVYNALARKYGQLDAIHVELTRDIKKSHKDRNDIKKLQEEFQERKQEAKEKAFEVLDTEPNSKELLKFRLWQEQEGYCIYSGNYIEPHVLQDAFATEVDHILPYSRSLDDSLNNKVLCFSAENQNKGSKTPFEYIDSDQWNSFEGRIKGYKNIKQAKKSRLLKKNFDENSENAFKERNKNDTSYLSKFIKNYLEAHIEFKASKMKRHVYTMNGMLTSQLRYKWGVGDKNRDNHLHHAEDAILLAFSTQSNVKKLSDISAKHEGLIYQSKEEKSKKFRFETPIENFRDHVKESIDNIFVSHMPRRKISGAAHKETIYSKSIKSRGVIEINKGLAEAGEVKRIDVFMKDNKYHFVYLHVNDLVKLEIKNISIKGIEIDNAFQFVFSIFKNDLIELQYKDKNIFGYLKFAEGDGRFHILDHSKSVLDKKLDRHSTGSVKIMKKYQVDALGSYVEVKSEKRAGTMKQDAKAKRIKRAKKRAERKNLMT